MFRPQNSRPVGLGFAGVGTLRVVASLVITSNEYWILLLGSAFVFAGVPTYAILGRESGTGEFMEDDYTTDY